MRPELLAYLACLQCRGSLSCDPSRTDEYGVIEGTLRCAGCASAYPIRRGIPRMLPAALSANERATSSAFGAQWKLLSELSEVFRKEFESYLEPLPSSELNALTVLDAGCGMGKFSYAAARAGARAVIGVDLSEAVEVAHGHLRSLPNAHVVQASIYHLPFQPGTFDFVFSIGVLHHLPDPEEGFHQVVSLAAPRARILVWLYALEGNEFFVRWLDPLRTHVFSHLPSWPNRVAATLLAVPLWAIIRTLYIPMAHAGLAHRLPYADYFLYFARLGFRTFWGTVYDKLVPPVTFYLTEDDIRRWLDRAGLGELTLRHRNGNSWTCLARKDQLRATGV